MGCSDPLGAPQSLCPMPRPAWGFIFPGPCELLHLCGVGETEAQAVAAVGSGHPKCFGHGLAVPLAPLSTVARIPAAALSPASQPRVFSKGFKFKRLQRSRAGKRRGAAAAPPQAPPDTKMV